SRANRSALSFNSLSFGFKFPKAAAASTLYFITPFSLSTRCDNSSDTSAPPCEQPGLLPINFPKLPRLWVFQITNFFHVTSS
ncbi:MAG: hypothetical protein H7843_10040, partial [Nitrospirota bacterium]